MVAALATTATDPSREATVRRNASSTATGSDARRFFAMRVGITLASVVIEGEIRSSSISLMSAKLSTSPFRTAVT